MIRPENKEELGAYGRAIGGGFAGALRYYVKPELTAKRAWAVMLGGIAIYEWACPAGETLSEGVDKALEHKKLLTTVAVAVTAAHLLNLLPESIDPYHQLTEVFKNGNTARTGA